MFSGDAWDIEGLGALEDRGRNASAGDVVVHRRDPRGANGSVTSLQIVQLPHPLTTASEFRPDHMEIASEAASHVALSD
jgi:hypothetical protein